RRARERPMGVLPEPEVEKPERCTDRELLLDQELSRLPDIYRTAIVLCDLQGRTRQEAARHLGVPEGTVAARLTRGRTLLAPRLARRGVAVPGGALAALWPAPASVEVPASLLASALESSRLLAAGQTLPAGSIPAPVVALTEGVLKTMFLSRLK